MVFGNGREMGIVTPLWARPARLLASGPTRWWVGRGGERNRPFGRGSGLGLSAEELLLTEAKQGVKPLDFGLELGLAIQGAAMHGLPIGGLSPGFEFLLQAWANRTGALRNGRSGADGAGRRLGTRRRSPESIPSRDRDPQGDETRYGARAAIHDGRL